MTDDDRDLYESFKALRREEEAHVPAMAIPSTAAQGHRPRSLSGRLIPAAVCLAAMLVAALWLLHGTRLPHPQLNSGPGPLASSISSWKPPTDFLLDAPGRELLQGVPAIGEWRGVAIAPRPSERHHPASISRSRHKEEHP